MSDPRLVVEAGDLTSYAVDAVVNAANAALAGGGGVDGALHRAAGPRLLEACRALGGCATGDVKLTPGFDLPARFVLHAVGPVWRGGEEGEPEALASCYRRALELAVAHDLRTVAFAAISCGVYGYPVRAACELAVATCRAFLAEDRTLERVTLVAFGEPVLGELRRALASR